MIEVKNLTKYYGDKPGISDVSFSIGDGEIVGLLGPNGAGKSTLMKMLAGYHMPSAGSITIDGVDAVAEPKTAMAKVGFMPEIPPLYVDMSVVDFLEFCAHIKGVAKNEVKRHVADVMQTASITEVSGRLIRNLSKGYRQRVGLAQALIGQADILIMDEPTVGLDPKQMAEFRELVLSLKKDHTIILSSHILSEINQVCEKLLIFNRGRLIAQDSVENLEADLDKNDKFTVKLKAGAEEAMALLQSIEGISEVLDCSDAAAQSGCCLLSAEGRGEALRERLFNACAKAGMPILELRSDRPTLEQVFLRLTDSAGEEAQL